MFQGRNSKAARLNKYAQMMGGCMLTSCLATTPAAAMATVLFVGELQPYQASGLRMLCLGTFLAGMYLAIFSKVPNMQLSAQLVIAPQLSGIVVELSLPLKGQPELFFLHFALSLGFVAIICGTLFFVVGRLRLAKLVQALPFPVITGFVAFTGSVILSNGLELATGKGFTRLHQLSSSDGLLLIAPLFMVLFSLLFTHGFNGYCKFSALSVMLFVMCMAILFFYVGAHLTGGPILDGFLFDPLSSMTNQNSTLPDFIGGSHLVYLSLLAEVDWLLVFRVAGPVSISIAFILLIKFLLALPALERLIGIRLSYNDEMKRLGVAYLLGGCALTSSGGYSINSMVLVHKTGAKRLPGLFSVGLSLLLVFWPQAMTYMPKFVLSALVLNSGVEVLEKSLFIAFRKMPRIEYFGVVLPMVVLPFFVPGGVPVSVGYGLLVCFILFIYEHKNFAGIRGEDRSLLPTSYAQLSSPRDLFVKFVSPGFHRSRVVRPPSDVALLCRDSTPLVSVIRLSGPLFFATTLLVSDAVKTRHRLAKELLLPLRFLIIDFTFATSLDTSAAQAISELLASSAILEPDCSYLLTRTSPEMRLTLTRAGVKQNRWWGDWDHCMEWVEERLLEDLRHEDDDHDSTHLLSSRSVPSPVSSLSSDEWFSREAWNQLVQEMCQELAFAHAGLEDLFSYLHPVSVSQGKLIADDAEDDKGDFSLLFLYSGTIESSSALIDRALTPRRPSRPEAFRLRDELTEADQIELFPLGNSSEPAVDEKEDTLKTIEKLEQQRRISKRGRGHVLNICRHMGVAGLGGSSSLSTTVWAASHVQAFGLRHRLVEGIGRESPLLLGRLYQLLVLQLAHRYESAKADTARMSMLVRWR